MNHNKCHVSTFQPCMCNRYTSYSCISSCSCSSRVLMTRVAVGAARSQSCTHTRRITDRRGGQLLTHTNRSTSCKVRAWACRCILHSFRVFIATPMSWTDKACHVETIMNVIFIQQRLASLLHCNSKNQGRVKA